MYIARQLLAWSLALLGIALLIVLLKPGPIQYAVALGESTSSGVPSYIHAGMPFTIQDGYATQFCVSSLSGRPLLPFVTPVARGGPDTSGYALPRVEAWVPFMVKDRNGTQVCVSTRSGQAVAPLIMP